MLTSLAVPPGSPLLVGVLHMHRNGPDRGRPTLSIRAWCPACRADHWADLPVSHANALEVAVPILAPCLAGPWSGETIYLALDPSRLTDARRMLQHHGQALRRFLVERRLRLQFAETRADDRRHARAGWDVVASPWLRSNALAVADEPPGPGALMGGLGSARGRP